MAGGNVFIPAFPVLDNASIVAALGYTPVNQAGDSMTGTLTVTPAGNTSALVLTGGTITALSPLIDMTRTWNNGAVTFTALKLNVTDTASASASLFLDMQIAGVSKFSVSKTGGFAAATGVIGNGGLIVGSRAGMGGNAAGDITSFSGGRIGFVVSTDPTAAPDTYFTRGGVGNMVANGTLATAAPAGSSAGNWKLGALQTAAVVLDTTRSIFVDIGGTVYKLMVAQ